MNHCKSHNRDQHLKQLKRLEQKYTSPQCLIQIGPNTKKLNQKRQTRTIL